MKSTQEGCDMHKTSIVLATISLCDEDSFKTCDGPFIESVYAEICSPSLCSLPKHLLSQVVKCPARNKEEYYIIMKQTKIVTGV